MFISGLFFEPLIPELDQGFLLEPLIGTHEHGWECPMSGALKLCFFGCYQRGSVFISGWFFRPLIPELDEWSPVFISGCDGLRWHWPGRWRRIRGPSTS
ncbi:MAG: hypothetical protein ACK480_16810, partial [Planctomycetota bacterium]